MEEMESPDVESPQGDVIEKVKAVGQGLSELAQMLDQSGAAPEDKEQMAQLISMFSDLVDKNLGGPVKADQAAAPEMGGLKGVPMGPQTRQ